METQHNIRLTSAEMANLWSSYMTDSMITCVLKYFLNKVEDTEVKPVIEYALSTAQKHIQNTVPDILTHEKFPVPQGFTDDDVDINAPRLYSDSFFLHYILNMGKTGLAVNGVALALASRSDVYDYYNECLASSAEVFNKARKVLLSKGLYIRPAYISTPEKVDFVHKQSFLTGWFGDRRPLLGIELANLYSAIQTNTVGKALIMGFSQVAKQKQIREYMVRGKEIASKHIEVFSSIMRDDDIPAPSTWDGDVMDSTNSPFSDKLMMFHVAGLNAMGVSNYGTALSSSPRRDLGTHYVRLTAEILKYAEDGSNIMIEHGWMEQPPQADNRKELAKV